MRTTLNLDDDLIRELMKTTRAKTKTDAIHQAISDMIRRKKQAKLKSLSGKIRINFDWRKQEDVEIRQQKKLARRWHGRR